MFIISMSQTSVLDVKSVQKLRKTVMSQKLGKTQFFDIIVVIEKMSVAKISSKSVDI